MKVRSGSGVNSKTDESEGAETLTKTKGLFNYRKGNFL